MSILALNDVVQTVLPQLIDADGNIQTQPCFAIPMRILNSKMHRSDSLTEYFRSTRVKLSCSWENIVGIRFEGSYKNPINEMKKVWNNLQKVGFDFRLLKTNLVLFNATLTGIQLGMQLN